MPAWIAKFAWPIGAAMVGIGMVAWAWWPIAAAPVAGGEPGSPRAASIVHLDGDGHPIVPEHPPDMGAPNLGGEASGSAAGIEDPPLPEPAPGGGEMVVVGDRLRHYSTAEREGEAGLRVGCERDVGRRADTADDE